MLNKFIIGSANFGSSYGITNKNKKKITKKEINNILELAHKNKCKTIDTASVYDFSEKIIGNLKISKKFDIITKFKNINLNKKIDIQIRESLDKSLRNLKRKKIYALLIHDSKYLISKKSYLIFETLKKLKSEKKIKFIGVSLSNFNHLDYVLKYNFDIIQASLNVFDQRILNKKVINKIKRKNISIHARSIFLQGSLLEKKIPQKLKKYKKNFLNFENFLIKNNLTREAGCLHFILMQKKFINKYIFGINSLNEIKQIIKCLKYLKLSNRINYSELMTNKKNLIDPFRW